MSMSESSPVTITATDLRRRLARDPQLRMIDVRTPAEFREVHVVGAQNKPLDRLDPAEFAGQSAELHVLCRSGSRAATACAKLAAAGVGSLVLVEGGTLACVEVGVQVARGKKAIALDRQVRIAAGSLVVLGVLLGWLAGPAWSALAAFVGAGLVFSGVTDTCGMGMLIAKAPWNQGATGGQRAGGPATGACSVGGPK